MEPVKQSLFIEKLQQQAQKQAQLEKKRVLPQGLSIFAEFVVRYSWQSLLIASGLTAVLIELLLK